ncbi:MAG: hypothetical protein ACK5ME_12655 [Parahaliea sp.]
MSLFQVRRELHSHTARFLLLAVLLCVVGLPLLEAGHTHDIADDAVECLLCKSAPVLLVYAAIPLAAFFPVLQQYVKAPFRGEFRRIFLPPQPRAPPACS